MRTIFLKKSGNGIVNSAHDLANRGNKFGNRAHDLLFFFFFFFFPLRVMCGAPYQQLEWTCKIVKPLKVLVVSEYEYTFF